jgi:hypothetical protein
MRYADLFAQISKLAEQREDLDDRCRRRYVIRRPDEHQASPISITLQVSSMGPSIDLQPTIYRVDSDLLAKAAEATAYIERWVRGEIDDLAPSGDWDQLAARVTAPQRHDRACDDRDARRYRRLRVLGAAPSTSRQLKQGTVLITTNLDAFIDEDLRIRPSRGEVQ